MTAGSLRLVEAGFTSSAWKEYVASQKKEGKDVLKEYITAVNDPAKKDSVPDPEDFADHHWMEMSRNQMVATDYPSPKNSYFLIWETPHESIEPIYYWLIQQFFDLGFSKVLKITDMFTASEHSSFWGSGAQRLGLQQDKVMTFLASIGKLVKELFQLVREMRWIDERLNYYRNAKESRSADATLKGIWVDMVDGVAPGGQKTNVNIFLMAQQLQFTTLPDFFFATKVDEHEKIDDAMKKLNVNEGVKRVLQRKLYQYLSWRLQTHKELETRRKFTIHYLRQHWNIIKMYMQWVKPYLKQIERLSQDSTRLDSPGIIAAFESSLVDIEVLGVQKPVNNNDVHMCLLLTLEYRSKPDMQFSKEYSHRGPLHIGETKMYIRGYAWRKETIQKFIAMKNREDLALLASIDEQLSASMEALGTDLEEYLKEAGEQYEETPKEEQKKQYQPIWAPFVEVGKGFKELSSIFMPKMKKKGKEFDSAEFGRAGVIAFLAWLMYKNFKKSHGMVTW